MWNMFKGTMKGYFIIVISLTDTLACFPVPVVIYFDVLIGCSFPDEADRETVNSFPKSVLPIRVGKS